MRASGCDVPAWMLSLRKGPSGGKREHAPPRAPIGTGSKFDRVQARKKRSMGEASRRRAAAGGDRGDGGDSDGEGGAEEDAGEE